ncbi:MAG TPA: PilZ domain-containing protein [Rhizomicrobium sp.]|jgi:hypothetical protein
MRVDRDTLISKVTAERRRFIRVKVNLGGRLFVPDDGREARCQVVDMSPGGAQLVSDLVPEAGARIVLYVDSFGRFEAVVARPEQGRFGVRFNCSPMKRERVAEQLLLLMNRGAVDESKLRRHERTATTQGLAHFTRANGDIIACEVLDLSLSGVSLKTDVKPHIGEKVMIGQMSGRVVRHHESGIAVEFAAQTSEKPERPSLPFKRAR